jgi:hypothetical protein
MKLSILSLNVFEAPTELSSNSSLAIIDRGRSDADGKSGGSKDDLFETTELLVRDRAGYKCCGESLKTTDNPANLALNHEPQKAKST